MKYLKKIAALILFGICAITIGAEAQKSPYADSLAKLKTATPQQRAQMQTDLMKEKLALNATQYKQVSDLNLQYALKVEPILKSDDGQFSKYRKIKPLLDEKDERLKKIFTTEQFSKYEEVKKEMMDQARSAFKR